MGWYLDGRVTACVGTHTHVPTADARVLPGGTAYVHRCRHDRSARGRDRRRARARACAAFLTQMPVKFETSQDDPWLNAVVVEAGSDGLATSIEQLLIPAPGE